MGKQNEEYHRLGNILISIASMSQNFYLQGAQSLGQLLVGIGLGVVLMAQIWSAIPIAAAMMMIGCGATKILAASTFRSQILSLVNLSVYATIGCFAIAAQAHAAIGANGSISPLLWIDHGMAILLIVINTRNAIYLDDLPTISD